MTLKMPKSVFCPNCGAPVNATRSDDGYCVCEYCGSRVVVEKKDPRDQISDIVINATLSVSSNAKDGVEMTRWERRIRKNMPNYAEWSDYWEAQPTIHPEWTPPKKLPARTKWAIWLSFLGLSALSILGALGIL